MGLDLAISFDTTGSMYPCLTQVRRRVEWLVEQVAAEVPDVRFAVIAHGDYCDAGSTYVTKVLTFTRDAKAVCNFVREVGPTGGGDNPECYELVLHQATNLDWGSDERVLVLIGDDVPHSQAERQNYLHLDWKTEVGVLRDRVKATVHAVQCLDRSWARWFYDELPKISGGRKLTLSQFKDIPELLMAVVYKQSGGDERLQQYANELEAASIMNRGIATFIKQLSGEVEVADVFTTMRLDGLEPVNPSRFQVLDVERDTSIRDFVIRNVYGTDDKKRYSAGKGFYELKKKKVLVQEYKEIILQDPVTGDMFAGDPAWDMVGLPRDDDGRKVRASIYPTSVTLDGNPMRVFIQSTSYNRKLLAGTKFLYEVEGWID